MGQCANCSQWNTLIEQTVKSDPGPSLGRGTSLRTRTKTVIKSLSTVKTSKQERTSTGFSEFDRVLGGNEGKQGLVNGEVVLLSGEPGIGKSTLLLQLLFKLSQNEQSVVYVSAEESSEQIFIRAKRLFGKDVKEVNIPMINSADIDSILASLEEEKPDVVVVDSIQTVYTSDLKSLPGGAAQVKECASRITTFAKKNGITTIIVGHVTKEGIVAGPKLLEHLVDAVVSLEGEENSGYRILRSGKNRFGSTNEVGVFEMTDNGLADVKNISKLFIGEHGAKAVGVCTSAIVEGNRVLLVEVQALTNVTPFALPKRVAEGISNSKLQLLSAILSKHAGIDLSDKDIYVNIAGGFRVKEPAIELAVCLAIASSAKNKPLKQGSIAVGEVSLTGDLRKVARLKDRLKEAKRLKYENYYIPRMKGRSNFVGYRHIKDIVSKI